MTLANNVAGERKHLSSLNFLRGLAALLVCLFHIMNKEMFPENSPLCFFNDYGYVGVDIFFIISGFIIPYSMYKNGYKLKNFSKYLLKRIVRIEPPYIFSFLLVLCLRYFSSWKGDMGNWVQFVLHFGYLNKYFGYESYNVVYWTLAIEFQYYLLIGILLSLLIHSKKIFPALVLTVFAWLSWFTNLPYNMFILQYGFLFITGIILFLFFTKKIKKLIFIFCICASIILIALKNPIEVTISSIFTCLVILFMKKEWQITNFLGKISYSLYLTHTIIL